MSRRAAAAALLLAFGAFAWAADDPEALRRYGRHLAQECTSCHRSDTVDRAIPSLAGRPQSEIVALLQGFREGRKTNAVMISVAKSLDETQSAALAAYFSSLPAHASGGVK